MKKLSKPFTAYLNAGGYAYFLKIFYPMSPTRIYVYPGHGGGRFWRTRFLIWPRRGRGDGRIKCGTRAEQVRRARVAFAAADREQANNAIFMGWSRESNNKALVKICKTRPDPEFRSIIYNLFTRQYNTACRMPARPRRNSVSLKLLSAPNYVLTVSL